MLLWPRLATYTKRPSALAWISAVLFAPVKPSGTVRSVCTGESAPVAASCANTVTVDASSLLTYA